jgi:ABC-type branched-subunit amino acid transport system substrate-binding protein
VNDKLLELKRKKLQQQILYLRTELEETEWVFQDCLKEFDVEFRKYFKDPTEKKKGDVTSKPPEYDIPEVDVNMVFKKIAKKTHPDKLINKDISDEEYDAKVDMYKEAQRSVKNRDWSKVVEIAKELGIDISDIKNDDSEYLKESVEKLTEKIKQLKTTYAWKWGNTPDQEREVVKGMILQSLGLDKIKEKENGNI